MRVSMARSESLEEGSVDRHEEAHRAAEASERDEENLEQWRLVPAPPAFGRSALRRFEDGGLVLKIRSLLVERVELAVVRGSGRVRGGHVKDRGENEA